MKYSSPPRRERAQKIPETLPNIPGGCTKPAEQGGCSRVELNAIATLPALCASAPRRTARRMEKLRVDTDYSLSKKQAAMDEKVKSLENEREREAQRAQDRCPRLGQGARGGLEESFCPRARDTKELKKISSA